MSRAADLVQSGLIEVKLAIARAKCDKELKAGRELATKIKEMKRLKALRNTFLGKATYDRERHAEVEPEKRADVEKFYSYDCIPPNDRQRLQEIERKAAETQKREETGKRLEAEIQAAKRRIAALKAQNDGRRAQLKSKAMLKNHAEALQRQMEHYKETTELKTARLVARRGELRRALQSK